MNEPIHVTDAAFEKVVLKSTLPVVVDFWAPWCGPCKMIAPTVDAVANDFLGKVRVGKLNTDDNPNTATAYNISAIPALLVFKGGQVVDRFVGAAERESDGRQLTLRFACDDPALEIVSAWQAYQGPGPVHHSLVIRNRSSTTGENSSASTVR